MVRRCVCLIYCPAMKVKELTCILRIVLHTGSEKQALLSVSIHPIVDIVSRY